jgi:hypothetical protein
MFSITLRWCESDFFFCLCFQMNQLLKAIVSWVFLFGGVVVVMADVFLCLYLSLCISTVPSH